MQWWKPIVIFALAASGAAHGRPVELQPVALIETEDAAMEFARNSAGALAVDSHGRVHITFFSPDESSETPENAVWYAAIEEGMEITLLRMDDGDVGGGRHSTLAVDEFDAVHLAWQDYRHSTPAGSWIDNVEIYYNRKAPDGEFASRGTRISWTEADHQGDNGFAPKVAAAFGRAVIAWFDFHLNGRNAQIYLRVSDENGTFEVHPGIEDYRITALDDSIDQGARWIPDVAVLDENSLYAVWGYNTTGYQGIFVMEGRLIGLDGTFGPIETIADPGGTYFDPPRIASNGEGRMAVVFMLREAGRSTIRLRFRLPSGVWMEPTQLDEGLLSATQPVIRYGKDGLLYAIWQEDRGGVMQAVLAVLNEDGVVLTRQVVSSIEEDVRVPVIALHPDDERLVAAWINRDLDGRRSIVVLRESEVAIQEWALFE